jgi:hypothetical protein
LIGTGVPPVQPAPPVQPTPPVQATTTVPQQELLPEQRLRWNRPPRLPLQLLLQPIEPLQTLPPWQP